MSEAEAAIEESIDGARQQNAKSGRLRGAMSLARLRRQQGRQKEAVALLAPIYAWFTEGFDAADLKEAKTLLDQLTAPNGRFLAHPITHWRRREGRVWVDSCRLLATKRTTPYGAA